MPSQREIEAAQAFGLVQTAVARGHGAEAERLADKYRMPNLLRIGFGVPMSTDSRKAPPLKIG